MNTIQRFSMVILASLVLIGCEATSQDVKQAKNYRLGLAPHLGLSPEQVTVTPGHGVVYITISGVQLASDRERIVEDLKTLNQNNPKLDPLRWTFR
jgi:hypothetical protein